MNKKMYILLNSFNKVRRFVRIAEEFTSEIEIIREGCVLNGKSIMSLFSISLIEPMLVRIVSNDEKEIEIFNKTMEEFKYENKSK